MGPEVGKGILYICGTPIGNLEDMTLRGLRILKEVDFIAAEDTRHTVKLLNHYEISVPLLSYHEHNKNEKGPKIMGMLQAGKHIALVTDAGMPCISDPGQELVDACHKAGIPVQSVPGPTAVSTAVALSGLCCKGFIFDGFLPGNRKERLAMLETYKDTARPVVLYEAPHHLLRLLEEMQECLGNRNIIIIKELTKKYEKVQRLNLEEAIHYFQNEEPRGEYVLILAGIDIVQKKQDMREQWRLLDIDEHMSLYLSQGKTEKDAMKAVAKDRGVGKREIYDMLKKG